MCPLKREYTWDTRAYSRECYPTVDSGITNLIHDRCSCSLFTLSSVGTSRLETFQARNKRAWPDVSTQA